MYKVYLDSSHRTEKSLTLTKMVDGHEQELEKVFGDIDLVSSLEAVLKKHNVKVADISEVIPNLGPGSFTGLKMGVTVANVINFLNGKKTIAQLDTPTYGSEPNITVKEF